MKIQYRFLSWLDSVLSGWIPVERRLPKHKDKGVTLGIICFTLLQGYYPAVCLFSPSDKKWYRENENHDVTEFVSHWKSSTAPAIFFHEWIVKKKTEVKE